MKSTEKGRNGGPMRRPWHKDSKKLIDVAQNLEREWKRSTDGLGASMKSTFKRAAPSVRSLSGCHGQSPLPAPHPVNL